jgi:hypothetical protein
MNRTLSGKKWYLDLYASPDLPLNDQAAYIPNYQLDEKMKISYSIGLKINR